MERPDPSSDSAPKGGFFSRRLRRAAAHLPYLPQALSLVWAAAPGWTVGWSLLLVVQGILPVATVYLTRALVDSLVAALGAGGSWEVLRPTLFLVFLMAALMVTAELLRNATSYVSLAQSEHVRDHISSLIHRQSTRVDLAFYDSPDFFDRLHRARLEAGHRPVALLGSIGSLFQNGLTLVAMALVLIPYSPWLPLALFVSSLPVFAVVLRNRVFHHQWRRDTTADERRSWYYEWLLTARDTAAEVGLFGLGRHFRSAYQTLRRRLRGQRLALARREGLTEALAGVFGLVVTGAAMLWMVWRTVRGLVTLGDLALFYQAFNQGQRLMRSLLGQVGEIYSNMLFLGDLFEFLELEPRIVDPAAPPPPAALKEGIAFRDVTFRYPGRSRPVLDRFNLTIPAGRVTAILGANGSGKSTLLKLLCRFYDPEEGGIEFDGVDLRLLKLDEMRRLVTAVFQDPVRYSMTAAENIAVGSLTDSPGSDEIAAAAALAGADKMIAGLPDGYDTMLGTWFAGGSELSGGEWKRLALARTFVRTAPLILLDEPTSDMDPWTAADWVNTFREAVSGRTAVVVTHRVATAAAADIIHVLAAGEIVESGSHEDLVTAGGPYSTLWRT